MRRVSPFVLLASVVALSACAAPPQTVTPVPPLALGTMAEPVRTDTGAAASFADEDTVRLTQAAALGDVFRIEVTPPEGSAKDAVVIDDPQVVLLFIDALRAPLDRVPIPGQPVSPWTVSLLRVDAPAEDWHYLSGPVGGVLYGEQGYFDGQGVVVPVELDSLLTGSGAEAPPRTVPAPTAGIATGLTTPAPTAALVSERYGVAMRHPASWSAVPGYDGTRIGGTDGFLQLDAARDAHADIDAVAEQAARHALRPYGSQPSILHLLVAGQPARLVLPSPDQAAEMASQAQLIVAYPTPHAIDGEAYAFLVVYADVDHVRDLAATLTFQGAAGS